MNADDTAFQDDDEPSDALALETEADVMCPYCNTRVSITLDPAGGRVQDYVEDCEVCCRPWRVRLWYSSAGSAEVTALE
jgi:hypothetical protein